MATKKPYKLEHNVCFTNSHTWGPECYPDCSACAREKNLDVYKKMNEESEDGD